MIRTWTVSRRRALVSVGLIGFTMTLLFSVTERAEAQQPEVFSFFQKLEVSPEPFTDGYAYWSGKGKFAGSKAVFDLDVKLYTDDKSPNDPAPGLITLTKITYTISSKGTLVKEVELAGTVNLNNRTMYLVGDNVSMAGVIKSIWVRQPEKNARGPLLIHGQLWFPSGI